jgi:hypothetical protein
MKLCACALLLVSLSCTEKPPAASPPATKDSGETPHSPFGELPRAGEQSLGDAWRTFCDAQKELGDLSLVPREQRAAKFALYAHDHVRNSDFVLFIAEMQGTAPVDRRRRYLEQLAAYGIRRCDMGEWFFPAPDGG